MEDWDLLEPILSWNEKVVLILHMVRRSQFTEYDPKLRYSQPTRFCYLFNIALFDLDKESELERGPLLHEMPASKYPRIYLDDSINVISI
ncbi:hypothetical protein PR202_ga24239 [Eleusine coracana subsp. coracana]|uniref:Uncharacterized protein n=1 Tax=Eleusine coracana subsp. coracana TaxID=191504 RepID=A0AAV5D6D8_ELECO|nr:hypothetical protein PR202_ga24239 [Eleusine coracana subsp. coracana]